MTILTLNNIDRSIFGFSFILKSSQRTIHFYVLIFFFVFNEQKKINFIELTFEVYVDSDVTYRICFFDGQNYHDEVLQLVSSTKQVSVHTQGNDLDN